ncbi:Tat pathway signal sequence domain protein [Verrucomicrobia bacterium]|nr:Tat pathway signal sequence domain protein [Verrucomicrobiota bacterium]
MQIQRRDFLKRSALGVSGLLFGAKLAPAAESKPTFFDPFEKVALGKTKLKFSRLCMGTGVRGGNRSSNQTRMGREKFESLLRGAHERGVRLFDMADLYGTHPYLLPALKGIPRDDYSIVTKIWFHKGGIPEPERPDADVVVSRFLKELGTDYIDLVLVHCVSSGTWPEEFRRQMDLMAKLKDKGVIRAHGVSCHSLEALAAAANEPWVDSVHTRINAFGMSMDGPPEKVAPILRKIHDAGKGVIGMKIIGEGRLRDDEARRQESLRFVLNSGCVDVLNVGFERLEEIDDLAARVRRVPV